MKRIKYAKEPTLHVHRYIVVVMKRRKWRQKLVWFRQFRYCLNRQAVRELRDRAPKGAIVQVYTATHNFHEGWQA